jgi:hypothetical protein
MSKRLLLLGCLLNSFLYAQPATIAGKFPYQRDESCTALMVSNQITFIEEWGSRQYLHTLNQKTKSGLQLDYCKNKSNFLLWHSPVVVSCIINSQSNFKQ